MPTTLATCLVALNYRIMIAADCIRSIPEWYKSRYPVQLKRLDKMWTDAYRALELNGDLQTAEGVLHELEAELNGRKGM